MINFRKQKPPVGIEVIAYHPSWIDDDFNPNGLRIGFLNEDENGSFVSAKYCNYHDEYHTIEDTKPKPLKWKHLLT